VNRPLNLSIGSRDLHIRGLSPRTMEPSIPDDIASQRVKHRGTAMTQAHVRSAPAIAEHLWPGSRQEATSDAELIGRIAVGDKVAMQVLFVRHNVRVFRFVLGRVKDRSLAEDLVSEIFLEAWRQAHRFEARAAVSTWLLAIARHKAISMLHRLKAHDELDAALAIEDPSASPQVAAEIKDRDAVLRACLSKLSPNHREVLKLAYYHEEPVEAVAKIVGIPLNTVKTRMHYARKHLAALLLQVGVDRTAL
jgi:RNA polymerase sigma-70 factor (ECF subfamily)